MKKHGKAQSNIQTLVSLNTECLFFDLSAVRRFNFKFTNMSLQHILFHEASTRSPQSHSCLNGLFLCSIELGQGQCKWIFQGSLALLASFECATSCQKVKVWYMRSNRILFFPLQNKLTVCY